MSFKIDSISQAGDVRVKFSESFLPVDKALVQEVAKVAVYSAKHQRNYEISAFLTSLSPEKGHADFKVNFLSPSKDIGYENEILVVQFPFVYLFLSAAQIQPLTNLADDDFVPLQFDSNAADVKMAEKAGDSMVYSTFGSGFLILVL